MIGILHLLLLVFTEKQQLQIIEKLEDKLRLEKDMWFPTTLLASGLSVKDGKQDKLEILEYHFAKLGRHEILHVKIQC